MNKTIFEGKGDKNILILSGVHGNELTPIYCSYLLSKYDDIFFFDKKYIKSKSFKKLTILSSINDDGIIKNTRDIPNNSTTDINRMFNSELKVNIQEELKTLINENDVIIDIHSSPHCTEFALINQDRKTNSYIDFLKNIDVNYAIRYSSANTIKKYCLDLNKIAFTIELNGMNKIDYDSAGKGFELVCKIINNIRKFEVVESEPKYDTLTELLTYRKGLFITELKPGDIIVPLQQIGYVLDLMSFEKHWIQYKKDKAKIICFDIDQYVSGNKSICCLQKIED